MRQVALILIGVAIIVVFVQVVSGGPDSGRGSGDGGGYTDQYGGSASVYLQIERSSDCADLQETFDRAAANNDAAEPGSDEAQWTTGYMAAADDRMREVGCYE